MNSANRRFHPVCLGDVETSTENSQNPQKGGAKVAEHRWWERWYVVVAIVLLSAVPLLLPSTPPLVDVPGHLGRLRVELNLNSSTFLQRFFGFQWQLIGNLGVDLLIYPFNRVFGLELGVKLITLCIPPLTTVGLLLVSRQVHGRIQATALFSVPFVYGYPFVFGFLNFSLSLALALLAFALWLRMSRDSKLVLRSFLFLPLSCLIWVVHVFGWGVLGLLCWSSEIIRLRDRGEPLPNAALRASISCLSMGLPVFVMVLGRGTDVGGETQGFFLAGSKLLSVFSALRDRWLIYDCFSVAVALVLLGSAIFDRYMGFSRRLAIPVAILAATFVVMPSELFGSAYADMRLIPIVLALALLALHVTSGPKVEQTLALLGFLFVLARVGGNTISFAIADHETKLRIAVLKYIPLGAPVLNLVAGECGHNWSMPRFSHLGSFVITRRYGFSNDQFPLAGHLQTIKYTPAGQFMMDPSELTYTRDCQQRTGKRFLSRGEIALANAVTRNFPTTDRSLDIFPKDAFDYVWLIDAAGYTIKSRPELVLIWAGKGSSLFRIVHQPPRAAMPVNAAIRD